MTDQTERNQQNALHSTGPTSTEGKARSSQNATSHGMYSKTAYLPAEDLATYLDHKAGIFESLKPENRFQESLVLLIADNLWRLERYRRQETGCIYIEDSEFESRCRQEQRVQSGMHKAHKELKELQLASRADRAAAAAAAKEEERIRQFRIKKAREDGRESGFVPANTPLPAKPVPASDPKIDKREPQRETNPVTGEKKPAA